MNYLITDIKVGNLMKGTLHLLCRSASGMTANSVPARVMRITVIKTV